MILHPRPNLDYTAPVLSIDLAYEDWEIWPCAECLPWHLEVLTDNHGVFVREWHAAECPVLVRLLRAGD